jgi:CheY-like chemotaxis protein
MGLFDFIKKKEVPTTPLQIPQHTVLVVDDEQYIRESYQELLTDEGYNVITANHGQAGLTLATQYRPDVILLDIMMPVMDGMKALTYLQSDTRTAGIPVIILTNAGSVNNMEKAKNNFAHKFLIKSNTSPEEVLEIVKDALTGKPMQTPAQIPT